MSTDQNSPRAAAHHAPNTKDAPSTIQINVAASSAHTAAPASRRTVSLPPGHAVFTIDTADALARRLSTPLETLRSNMGVHAPGEARALAGAQQLVSAADALMAELVAHEHARRSAMADGAAAEQQQVSDFARLDKLTQHFAEVDEAFAACTCELDALLQRKLQLLDSLGDAEEQNAALTQRLLLQKQELSSKCDVIASLKASLFLALEDNPKALNDPKIAACFAFE